MLTPTDARTWNVMGRLSQTCRYEPAARRIAKLEAGLLLVEAEAVGHRGCFPAAGDAKLGQDP